MSSLKRPVPIAGGTFGQARPCFRSPASVEISPFGFPVTLLGLLEAQLGIKEIGLACAILLIGFSCRPAAAQVATPELELCRSTGLIALRERDPSVKDVSLDIDGMTVAKANTKVEDTPIKTIVIGDVYLEKGKKETRRTFLCLIGEKGKVLLTFFTDK
jgi:hypothetical protein